MEVYTPSIPASSKNKAQMSLHEALFGPCCYMGVVQQGVSSTPMRSYLGKLNTASSNEINLNSSYSSEHTKTGLNSSFVQLFQFCPVLQAPTESLTRPFEGRVVPKPICRSFHPSISPQVRPWTLEPEVDITVPVFCIEAHVHPKI